MAKQSKKRFSIFKKRDKQPNFILAVLCSSVAILLCVMLVIASAGFGAVIGIARTYFDTTPQLDVTQIYSQNLTSFLYDCNGDLITEYTGSEYRIWATADELPYNLTRAFVAVEDARFYTHNGIDIKRIAGAFISNLRNESTQGGSTITQQLVKNCLLTNEVSYKRKLQEAYMAVEMEKEYSKDQILEWYLNIVPLGGSNYGVKAAAKDYYDKDLNQLTLRECASLAAITRNPSRYNPRRCYFGGGTPSTLNDRTDYVLKCMYENNFISKADYEAALRDRLRVVETSTVNDLYDMPSAVETVLDDVVTELLRHRNMENTAANRKVIRNEIQTGGYNIYSTIDPVIQGIAEDVLYTWEDYPALADPNDAYSNSTKSEQPQCACVVYDFKEGEVRAVVGSRTPQTQKLVLNRATSANMPVGSSIKPLAVYGPALDLGASPGAVSSNLPLPIEGWNSGKGYPSNSASKQYTGMVTLRAGMRASLNIVAANTLVSKVGIQNSVDYLKALGVDESHINPDGSGLALGSSGITVEEMAEAYGTVANGGVYQKPLTFTKITDADGNIILDLKAEQAASQKQVFKPSTAYMLIDMLEDAVRSGTGTAAKIKGMTVGGKTGTHTDCKSVFFAGMTPYYSCALWVGSDDFKSLYSGATGGKDAAPIWQAVMSRIVEEYEQEDKPIFDADPKELGLQKVELCSLTGKLATDACRADLDYPPTTDWCLAEDIPTETCDQHILLRTDTFTGQLATNTCDPTVVAEVAYQIVPPTWLTDQIADPEKLTVLFPHGLYGYNNVTEVQTALTQGLLDSLYCTLHPNLDIYSGIGTGGYSGIIGSVPWVQGQSIWPNIDPTVPSEADEHGAMG